MSAYALQDLHCCLMYIPLFVGVQCWSLFWYALLYVRCIIAIIFARMRELLCFYCLLDVLFL